MLVLKDLEFRGRIESVDDLRFTASDYNEDVASCEQFGSSIHPTARKWPVLVPSNTGLKGVAVVHRLASTVGHAVFTSYSCRQRRTLCLLSRPVWQLAGASTKVDVVRFRCLNQTAKWPTGAA